MHVNANTNQAHVVVASGVLNNSSTVNLTASAGVTAVVTYTVGNAIDNLVFNAADGEITVANSAYLSATDTVTGGSSVNDGITFSSDIATTIDTTAASHAMLGVTGVETMTVNTTDATVAADYVLTLGDAFVAANMNTATNTYTITRDALDQGDTDVDGSAVSSSYLLAITGGTAIDDITGGAGADTLTGGAGADNIIGGAGNDEIIGGAGIDALTGGAGSDDFHVDITTTADTINDFNFGTTVTGSTVVDQIQINGTYLGGVDGADAGGALDTTVDSVDTVAAGVAGIDANTDVAVFTGTVYANAAALDTAIEALAANTVTQDFFAFYQNNFGDAVMAIAESDGTETGAAADYTVTDVFTFSGVGISSIASIISTDDFIVV